VQKHRSCAQADFCPPLAQLGYKACPASSRARKLLILWKKTNLSTESSSFTITINLYTYKLTKTVNSAECGDKAARDWPTDSKSHQNQRVAPSFPRRPEPVLSVLSRGLRIRRKRSSSAWVPAFARKAVGDGCASFSTVSAPGTKNATPAIAQRDQASQKPFRTASSHLHAKKPKPSVDNLMHIHRMTCAEARSSCGRSFLSNNGSAWIQSLSAGFTER
jgi:hypothetical protein